MRSNQSQPVWIEQVQVVTFRAAARDARDITTDIEDAVRHAHVSQNPSEGVAGGIDFTVELPGNAAWLDSVMAVVLYHAGAFDPDIRARREMRNRGAGETATASAHGRRTNAAEPFTRPAAA